MIFVLMLLLFLMSWQIAYLLDDDNKTMRGTTGFLLAYNVHTLCVLLEKMSA